MRMTTVMRTQPIRIVHVRAYCGVRCRACFAAVCSLHAIQIQCTTEQQRQRDRHTHAHTHTHTHTHTKQRNVNPGETAAKSLLDCTLESTAINNNLKTANSNLWHTPSPPPFTDKTDTQTHTHARLVHSKAQVLCAALAVQGHQPARCQRRRGSRWRRG